MLSDPHLRILALHKSYGTHHVLKGVSFDVDRGHTHVIVGPSGSGKTVLMRQLIRLETPDSGQILLDGQDIVPLGAAALSQIRRRFGMVFQMSALFDSMTVFDNVAFPLREHTKLRPNEVRERVMQRLEDLMVARAASKMPAELSGGMQKRVALARALVLETDIVIYDEPTTGLDPITSRTVDDLILEAREKFGLTSIVISHDMASVFRIADRITFLNFGVVDITASPSDLLETNVTSIRDFLTASGVHPDARTDMG